MQRIKGFIVAVAVILLAGCTLPPVPLDTPMTDMADEGGMASMEGVDTEFTTGDLAPLVLAFHEGEDVFFIHTEASDPQVAQMLTEMMGPQVVVVGQSRLILIWRVREKAATLVKNKGAETW